MYGLTSPDDAKPEYKTWNRFGFTSPPQDSMRKTFYLWNKKSNQYVVSEPESFEIRDKQTNDYTTDGPKVTYHWNKSKIHIFYLDLVNFMKLKNILCNKQLL